MTKTEMETRYQSAIKEIEEQKRASAAQSYAAGASILLYSDSKVSKQRLYMQDCS